MLFAQLILIFLMNELSNLSVCASRQSVHTCSASLNFSENTGDSTFM